MSEAEVLRSLHLFRFVPIDALESFASMAPLVNLPAGMAVFRQGAPADVALLLVTGRLSVRIRAGESELDVGTIWPGDVVGEHALFSLGGLRSATVTADVPSACRMVSWSVLDDQLAHPAVAALEDHLLSTLAHRLRRTNQVVQGMWLAAGIGKADAGDAGPADPGRLRDLLGEDA